MWIKIYFSTKKQFCSKTVYFNNFVRSTLPERISNPLAEGPSLQCTGDGLVSEINHPRCHINQKRLEHGSKRRDRKARCAPSWYGRSSYDAPSGCRGNQKRPVPTNRLSHADGQHPPEPQDRR